MRGNLFALAFDPTGEAYDNSVKDEQHIVEIDETRPNRVVVMDKGFFYSDSVVVKTDDRTILKRGTDYRVLMLHGELTQELGKPVAGMILITNKQLTGKVYVDAQMVGGEYCNLRPLVEELLERLSSGNQSINYLNVTDVPKLVPPVRHYQSIADTYGWKPIADQVGMMAYWVGQRNNNDANIDIKYIEDRIKKVQADSKELEVKVNTHIADENNPHKLTMGQVNLSVYAGRGVATRDLLYIRDSDPSRPTLTPFTPYQTSGRTDFVTPKLIDQYIEDKVGFPFREHIYAETDPHNTSLDEIGAYSKRDVDTMVASRYTKDETVESNRKVGGKSLDDVRKEVKDNLDASKLGGRAFLPGELGKGGVEPGKVLLGNGTWASMSDLIKRYSPHNSKRIYTFGDMGGMGDDQARQKAIQKAKSEIASPRVGDIVFYTEQAGFGSTQSGFVPIMRYLRYESSTGWDNLVTPTTGMNHAVLNNYRQSNLLDHIILLGGGTKFDLLMPGDYEYLIIGAGGLGCASSDGWAGGNSGDVKYGTFTLRKPTYAAIISRNPTDIGKFDSNGVWFSSAPMYSTSIFLMDAKYYGKLGQDGYPYTLLDHTHPNGPEGAGSGWLKRDDNYHGEEILIHPPAQGGAAGAGWYIPQGSDKNWQSVKSIPASENGKADSRFANTDIGKNSFFARYGMTMTDYLVKQVGSLDLVRQKFGVDCTVGGQAGKSVIAHLAYSGLWIGGGAGGLSDYVPPDYEGYINNNIITNDQDQTFVREKTIKNLGVGFGGGGVAGCTKYPRNAFGTIRRVR